MKNRTDIDSLSDKLEQLFDEVLDGIRADLTETDSNVSVYKDLIGEDIDMRSVFGSLYNDSLKIKGAARDRQLKFLNSFKERVMKKEAESLKLNNNSEEFDYAEFNKLVKDLKEERIPYSVPEVSFEIEEENTLDLEKEARTENEEE